MQDLITEGIARLAGASSQAIFHLKQAMGGGKTHLLVGFGLLAKQPGLRKTYCGGIPHASAFTSANIAAFNGRNSPDHFFWARSPTSSAKEISSRFFGQADQKLRTRMTGSSSLRETSPSLSYWTRCRLTFTT